MIPRVVDVVVPRFGLLHGRLGRLGLLGPAVSEIHVQFPQDIQVLPLQILGRPFLLLRDLHSFPIDVRVGLWSSVAGKVEEHLRRRIRRIRRLDDRRRRRRVAPFASAVIVPPAESQQARLPVPHRDVPAPAEHNFPLGKLLPDHIMLIRTRLRRIELRKQLIHCPEVPRALGRFEQCRAVRPAPLCERLWLGRLLRLSLLLSLSRFHFSSPSLCLSFRLLYLQLSSAQQFRRLCRPSERAHPAGATFLPCFASRRAPLCVVLVIHKDQRCQTADKGIVDLADEIWRNQVSMTKMIPAPLLRISGRIPAPVGAVAVTTIAPVKYSVAVPCQPHEQPQGLNFCRGRVRTTACPSTGDYS